ncbi:MAG: DNA alkylation repair protein [Patescibacteria group bacterium]
MINKLRLDIKKSANKKRAVNLQRYFKTGEGEYGFGDVFIGLTVPKSREIAIKYKDLDFLDITTLLKSQIHEERLIALLILVHQFQTQEMLQRRIYEFYLKNTKYINNWDLVDLSSPKIVGAYLIDKPKDILLKLSKSKNMWERRIAILATFNFINNKKFDDAIIIVQSLIEYKDDLIQKAVGWMLREIGKRDLKTEEILLKKYYKIMGRTALRYAIEKFEESRRKKYLEGTI